MSEYSDKLEDERRARLAERRRPFDERARRDSEDWARLKAEGEAAERRRCRAAGRPFDRARWLDQFCRCHAGRHPGAPRSV